MASFVDRTGRSWTLELDVHLIELVEKRTAVKVDELLGEEFAGLVQLFGNRKQFFGVLWVLCEAAADKVSVAPEDFARAMNGDALEAAGEAFVEALADFYPRHQRQLLKAVVARGRELQDLELPTKLARIRAYVPPSSTSATPAARSSDSIPAPAG